MRRITLVFIAAVLAAVAPATAASAKGDMGPATARVMITGPGLPRPIAARWEGSCFALARYACSNAAGDRTQTSGFPADVGHASGAFWTIADSSGMLRMISQVGGVQPYGASALGPRYHVTYVISIGPETDRIDQDLYPYGPSLVFGTSSVGWTSTPKGQILFGKLIGWGWVPADPRLKGILVRNGLPSNPPLVAEATPPLAKAAKAPAPALPVLPVLLGIAVLALMVVAGSILGRPKRHAVREPGSVQPT